MTTRTGKISVETSDILPIIKKWLYSEHDIFLRELVSNGSDAITKREVLFRGKNVEIPEGKVILSVNETEKTLTISDNGIGMTEAEVEKYIAQVAFSGAKEFMDKMQKAGIEQQNDIIGKFGLGFYSSFMVSDRVVVDTLSAEAGAKAVQWSCDGSETYEFSNSARTEVGTSITLYLNAESEEFLAHQKVLSTLKNYCDFMPYPIEVVDVKKTDDKPSIVNETKPLWTQDPSSLKPEDYKEFYKKLFPFDPEPLFWLHLNVEHPFELKGILYFPKLNPNKPVNESHIRLYCRQVFVSDNVKNIIPEFLGLLKGTLDSHDIPLNVSRSALQGDPNIRKISNYVVKKVAESLRKLYQSDREEYEKIWNDIGLFVKYGSISDAKFDESIRAQVLLKSSNEKFMTIEEVQAAVPAELKEIFKDTIIYAEQGKFDPTLLKTVTEKGLSVILTDSYIDPHFTQHLEAQPLKDQKIQFLALEEAVEKIIGETATSPEDIKVKDFFAQTLEAEKNDNLEVETKKLQNSATAAYFKVDQQMKRFQQMTRTMGQTDFTMPLKKTFIVNTSHPLIQNALKLSETKDQKKVAEKICHHVFDLATLSSEGLDSAARETFVTRSQELMSELSSQFLK